MREQQQDMLRGCGQACVAMILEREQHWVRQEMGKRGPTTTADLCRVLEDRWLVRTHHRFAPRGPLTRYRHGDRLPRLAILKLRTPGKNSGHWVVHKDGLIFDPNPALPGCPTREDFEKRMSTMDWKVTSYLRIDEYFVCGCLRTQRTPAADYRGRCWTCAGRGA